MLRLKLIHVSKRGYWNKASLSFISSTVSVDGPAPLGDRASAGKVMTKLGVPVLRGLKNEFIYHIICHHIPISEVALPININHILAIYSKWSLTRYKINTSTPAGAVLTTYLDYSFLHLSFLGQQIIYRTDSRFAPSQCETVLFWLGASLESALI